MTRCNLTQTDDGWWCKVCDPHKRRLLKGKFKVKCQAVIVGNHSVATFGPRTAKGHGRPQDVMADRYAKNAHNGRHEVSLETLLARVDKCVTMGCEHFDEKENVCTNSPGSKCKRGLWWFGLLMKPEGCKLQEADHGPSS